MPLPSILRSLHSPYHRSCVRVEHLRPPVLAMDALKAEIEALQVSSPLSLRAAECAQPHRAAAASRPDVASRRLCRPRSRRRRRSWRRRARARRRLRQSSLPIPPALDEPPSPLSSHRRGRVSRWCVRPCALARGGGRHPPPARRLDPRCASAAGSRRVGLRTRTSSRSWK